jgi:hypothetical protein
MREKEKTVRVIHTVLLPTLFMKYQETSTPRLLHMLEVDLHGILLYVTFFQMVLTVSLLKQRTTVTNRFHIEFQDPMRTTLVKANYMNPNMKI